MKKHLVAVIAIGTLMLMASCATTKERTLPALNASKVLEAKALTVEIQDASFYDVYIVNGKVVHGSGEGALVGMQTVLEGTGEVILEAPADESGAIMVILAILALPVTVPTGAGVGAVLAHSDEEFETAAVALRNTNQDHRTQLGSLDRKIILAIQDHDIGQWDCIATASLNSQQCAAYSPHARLKVTPNFSFTLDEDRYDPEVTIFGDFKVIAIVESGNSPLTLFDARWVYREELGSYFGLAQDDGALLRQKMEGILDKFVQAVVSDIFLTSESHVITEKKVPGRRDFELVLPEGKVMRLE